MMRITYLLTYLLTCPALYAQIKLYEISGNGLTKPSYIYATLNSSDNRAYEINDMVFEKIKECDAFASTMEYDSVFMNAAFSMMMETSTYKSNIKEELTKEEIKRLQKIVNSNFEKIDLTQYSAWQLLMGAYDQIRNKDMEDGVDRYLIKYSNTLKKNFVNIEPMSSVKEYMDKITFKDVLWYFENLETNTIIENLKVSYYQTDSFNKIVAAWNINPAWPVLYSSNLMMGLYPLASFYETNMAVAKAVDETIQKQPTFVALRAERMFGEKGALELLRKSGYAITPLTDKNKTITYDDTDRWFSVKSSTYNVKFPFYPDQDTVTVYYETGKTIATKIEVATVKKAMKENYPNCGYKIKIYELPIESNLNSDMPKQKLEEFFYNSIAGNCKKFALIGKAENITWGAYPGKEYHQDATLLMPMNITVRMYLVKKRVYEISVIDCSGGTELNQEAKKFFDSFSIVE